MLVKIGLPYVIIKHSIMIFECYYKLQLHFQIATRSIIPGMTTVFHVWQCGGITE